VRWNANRNRTTTTATAAALVLALLAAGLVGRPARGEPPAKPTRRLQLRPAAPEANTDCGACHVESRWSEVRFDHDRTGFPLNGAHAAVTCRGCHRQDFRARIADTCAGCHRDRHAGELGQHCEGCHDAKGWLSPMFRATAHSSTGFPLIGRHAAIPCQDCHGNVRDRTFDHAPLPCVGCHRADYDRAASLSIDHAMAGFGTDCQGCHSSWSFFPARFAAHDICFEISAGSHRPFRCQQCHTSVAGLKLTGTCNTQTTICSTCHDHLCARSDQQHPNVPGYACVNQKCYECHQQAGK
jgi:hypothetical protein